MFVGYQLARTEAVHSGDVHAVARHLHTTFFAASLDKGQGSKQGVESPASDRGINPPPLPCEGTGDQTARDRRSIPREDPIDKDKHLFFSASYLGLQKISDHGILMIPRPKI